MNKPDSDKDDEATDSGKSLEYRSPGPKDIARSEAGMFTIVKKGQGYWTRMGTAGVAVLLIALVAYNAYAILKGQFSVATNIALGVGIGSAVALAIVAWRLMNKPSHVDFLIATDS